MWLLLRLVLTILSAVLRCFWRNMSAGDFFTWNNEIVYRRGSRRGGTSWGVRFDRPLVFELLKEYRSDRWLKHLGLLVEQQTGNTAFDSMVYIRGDHPGLGRILARDATAKAAITELFSLGVGCIIADGSRLWIKGSIPTATRDELLAPLLSLQSSLRAVPADEIARVHDFIPWRIAAIEGLVWGIATYAILGISQLWRLGELPLAAPRFIAYTTSLTVLWGSSCLVLILLVLRRSSWMKLVLWEAGLVSLVAIPVSSAVLLADANRFLDRTPRQISPYRIVERLAYTYSKPDFSIRGGIVILTDRLVRVEAVDPKDPPFRRYVPVSRSIYENPNATIQIVWGAGALGFPWVDSINPVSVKTPKP